MIFILIDQSRTGWGGVKTDAAIVKDRAPVSFSKNVQKKEKSDGTARQKISCRDDGCVASGSG